MGIKSAIAEHLAREDALVARGKEGQSAQTEALRAALAQRDVLLGRPPVQRQKEADDDNWREDTAIVDPTVLAIETRIGVTLAQSVQTALDKGMLTLASAYPGLLTEAIKEARRESLRKQSDFRMTKFLLHLLPRIMENMGTPLGQPDVLSRIMQRLEHAASHNGNKPKLKLTERTIETED